MTIQIKHQNQLLNRPIRRSNTEVTLQTTTPLWTKKNNHLQTSFKRIVIKTDNFSKLD